MPVECYRFKIAGLSTGVYLENILHFNVDNNDDATPLALASELVNKWHADFKDPWLAEQSNRYGIRFIEAKRVLPSGGNSYWKEYPEGTETGGNTGEQNALQCAPIVKLYGGLATTTQGRIFLPSPPDNALDDNVLDPTYVGDIIDMVELMLSFSDVHDWVLAIRSRKNHNAVAVTTISVSPIIGSISRRRIPG